MKKVIMLLALIAAIAQVNASFKPTAKPSRLKASELYFPIGTTGKWISMEELSVIRIKDFESLSGKKMNLKEKVMFKGAQRKLQSYIQTDGTIDKRFAKHLTAKRGLLTGFNIGGFLLGLFLSLIGVLIAYLISDESKKSRVKWAWIGAIISFIIWGAILI